MTKKLLSSIKDIIKDARKGKKFLLVDDKNRENEGDLIIPGSKCSSNSINFMAMHGRGLICLALEKKQVENLTLPLMSSVNKARMQTAFTVSIEAKKGITTGISAFDRAKTIKVAINPSSKKKDIVSPGHVFPLVAKEGGVLERAGHTEASIDISKLANLNPSAVICEVMNEDGRMARLKDLLKFSKKHRLKIATIEDLISYRLKNEKLVTNIGNKFLKIKRYGNFEIKTFKNELDKSEHYVICKGKLPEKKQVRVRVVSIKITKTNINFDNIIIKKSLNHLSKYNNFVLILIRNPNLSYKKNNLDNTKSSKTLRYYGIGAQIIKDLRIKNMILVSRSKKKIIGLEGFGIKIVKQEIIK